MIFDVGAGISTKLSGFSLKPTQIDAIFLTHMHNDHTDGLENFMWYRWLFNGPPITIVCTADVTVVYEDGTSIVDSCKNLLMTIGNG